ncbi:MAG: hypothetical protein AAF732_20585, partial [Pseudomonadota bacterium]
ATRRAAIAASNPCSTAGPRVLVIAHGLFRPCGRALRGGGATRRAAGAAWGARRLARAQVASACRER